MHLRKRKPQVLRSLWRVALIAALLLGTIGCSAPVERRTPVRPIILEEDEGPKNFEIPRELYEEIVKAGLQPVMRWYLFQPAYATGGRFVGFMVTRILKEELQAGPLKLGDVLTKINQMPIERPGQVEMIWRGLWEQRFLTLDLVRDNALIRIKIPIVSSKIEAIPMTVRQ
jgi:hypothetical protein